MGQSRNKRDIENNNEGVAFDPRAGAIRRKGVGGTVRGAMGWQGGGVPSATIHLFKLLPPISSFLVCGEALVSPLAWRERGIEEKNGA